jgi:hypothetical protein
MVGIEQTMTFPRICSVVLALGGSFWALLLWWQLGFLDTAGSLFFWALLWTPGFFAWYGYIRRAFGHFLFHRALFTWLISIIANSWSLFCVWLYSQRGEGDLSFLAYVSFSWLIVANIISIICLIRERNVREPKHDPTATTRIEREDFKKLLDEHRRDKA